MRSSNSHIRRALNVTVIKCAVVFTDICNSTYMWNVCERNQMSLAVARHEEMIRNVCFDIPGGRVIKTIGDACMLSFESLEDAIQAAVQIQNNLNHNHRIMVPHKDGSAREQIKIRIGIAFGKARTHTMIVGTKGDEVHLPDVHGPIVNLASRAESEVCPAGDIAIGYLRDESSDIILRTISKVLAGQSDRCEPKSITKKAPPSLARIKGETASRSMRLLDPLQEHAISRNSEAANGLNRVNRAGPGSGIKGFNIDTVAFACIPSSINVIEISKKKSFSNDGKPTINQQGRNRNEKKQGNAFIAQNNRKKPKKPSITSVLARSIPIPFITRVK